MFPSSVAGGAAVQESALNDYSVHFRNVDGLIGYVDGHRLGREIDDCEGCSFLCSKAKGANGFLAGVQTFNARTDPARSGPSLSDYTGEVSDCTPAYLGSEEYTILKQAFPALGCVSFRGIFVVDLIAVRLNAQASHNLDPRRSRSDYACPPANALYSTSAAFE